MKMAKKMIIKGVGTIMARRRLCADGGIVDKKLTLGAAIDIDPDDVNTNEVKPATISGFSATDIVSVKIGTTLLEKVVFGETVALGDDEYMINGDIIYVDGGQAATELSVSYMFSGSEVGDEIITLGTLQNLKIDMNVETDDIFGGDGVYPIDNLVKQKMIDITATDAKFDLGAVSLMMGDSVVEDVSAADKYVWELNETKIIDTSGEVILKYDVFAGSGDEIIVRFVDTNKTISKASGSPSSTQFAFTSGKTIKFDVSNAGKKVYINYKREIEDVAAIFLTTDEVPFEVSIVHHGVFSGKCNKKMGIETELYACRAKGTFTIDAQRAAASASSVSLQIVDPERADKRIGSVKVFEVA